MAIKTQLGSATAAIPGRRYGSFAGRTPAATGAPGVEFENPSMAGPVFSQPQMTGPLFSQPTMQ